MTLIDIENLTAAELKEQRGEVLKAILAAPHDEVAQRCYQARLDAKARDEKLAEQGKTITLLQDSHESFKQTSLEVQQKLEAEVRRLEQELNSAKATANNLSSQLQQERQSHEADVADLRKSLADQTARADRLKVEATRHQQAVIKAAALLNEALAAQQVEDADEGTE